MRKIVWRIFFVGILGLLLISTFGIGSNSSDLDATIVKSRIFMDTYEDNPTFTKTTHDLWMQMMHDSKNGDYWGDQVHWLEVGTVNRKGKYTITPTLGDAVVTDAKAHEGTKSVEVTIYEVPQKYILDASLVARYFRNPSIVKDGVYEVGAWFYVPNGYIPYYVHVAMENHLSWYQYFAHFGVNPETSELVVAVSATDPPKIIDQIDFQYDTWFKLWIRYDTLRPRVYTAGYKSPIEEKIYELDIQMEGPNLGYLGWPGFNLYAGGLNLPGRIEQKLYVDGFYAKALKQDNTPPQIKITNPCADAIVHSVVKVTASAKDDVGVTKVEFRLDGVLKATDTAAPYTWNLDTKKVKDGRHKLKVIAYDAAGNEGNNQITITVDNTPPKIKITNPCAGATVHSVVKVTASVTDDVGVTKVEFRLDGVLKATDTTAPYTWNWDTTKVKDGRHKLKVTAYDGAGNEGYHQITITVDN